MLDWIYKKLLQLSVAPQGQGSRANGHTPGWEKGMISGLFVIIHLVFQDMAHFLKARPPHLACEMVRITVLSGLLCDILG